MSRRKRNEDDENLSENENRRSRRSKRYSDDEEDEKRSRRNRKTRYSSEEEEADKKTQKEKESKPAKTRRYSDEDDDSEDQSSRRRRRRDDDEAGDRRKSQRNRRVEYSDEEDSKKTRRRRDNDDGKGRSSRRSRQVQEYSDEDEESEEEEDYNRKRSGRRSRRRDDDSPPRRSSRRSSRRTRREPSDEDLPVKSKKKQTRYSDDEDDEEKPRRNEKLKDEKKPPKDFTESEEDLEEIMQDQAVTEKEPENNPFNKYTGTQQNNENEGKENTEETEKTVIKDNPFNKYVDEEEETTDNEKEQDNQDQDDEEVVNENENPFQKYTQKDQEENDNNDNNQKDEEEVEEKPKAKPKNPFEKYTASVDKKKKPDLSVGKSALKSTGRISIGKLGSSKKPISSLNKKQNSVDKSKESTEKADEKKKRRREKDASSSILDVINWKLDSHEKFEGSDIAPDTEIKTYESKLEADPDENNTISNNDDTEAVDERDSNNDDNDAVDEREYVNKSPINNANQEPENASQKASSPSLAAPVVIASTPRVNGHIEVQDSKISNPVVMNGDISEIEKERTSSSDKVSDTDLQDSLKYLDSIPDLGGFSKSSTLSSLMETYLDKDHLPGRTPPVTLTKPQLRKTGKDIENMEELEKNLKSIREKNKKQPPPPVRSKPTRGTRTWEDPKEHQRFKKKEKQWPPLEPPTDTGAYIVESYGQTDPLSKRLIKDIQRSKREDEEKREAEKRSEVVSENTEPVSHLRDTFNTKVPKPRPGVQKPDAFISEEKSWIKHEKKAVEFDKAPDEPDWMQLIRNRRWKSTVKARFPCRPEDKSEFDRRSTTPKNWKRLAKDKNALRMLSEIVGIGAEGEELFMRLAAQRQKVDEEEEQLDELAEEELMAYEVARETLGEEAAYSLQMDNPLPAARMVPMLSTSTMKEGSEEDSTESFESFKNRTMSGSSAYPFTTSQLEAAYLTNQLLRLHPEEFKKLMSLERSRQATLRWQFSADPFDSVHEHQSLPLEIALLASEEPRVTQAMKRILARSNQGDDSVFGTPVPSVRFGRPSRIRSDGGYSNSYFSESEYDADGYESSASVSSVSSIGGTGSTRGRSHKKKKPIPPPTKPRCRSVSPGMLNMRQDSSVNYAPQKSGSTLNIPQLNGKHARKQVEDDREVHAHGLLTDEELALSEEIAKLQELTSNIGKDINEELKSIEASLDERKKGFFEDAIRKGSSTDLHHIEPTKDIDINEISSRRESFIKKDRESTKNINSNVRNDLPKTRHKVRRINSSAQLDAVFRRRKQISESDMEDNDDDDDINDKIKNEKKLNNDATIEMTNLIKDINETFGTDK